jgi:hypothetical protein
MSGESGIFLGSLFAVHVSFYICLHASGKRIAVAAKKSSFQRFNSLKLEIHANDIVAGRLVAWQRPRNKQLYNRRY